MKLNAHQSVGEAIVMMRDRELDALPVYLKDVEIGRISYDDLIKFLGDPDDNENVYFHKLNFNIGIALHILEDQRENEARKSLNYHGTRNSYKTWAVRFSIAAVIAVLFFGLAWAAFKKIKNIAVPDKTEFITLKTGYGEIKKVKLADGSMVLLNAVSQLSYPASFEKGKDYKISLIGEALVKTASDNKAALVIGTAKQSIRVEGDSLNVKAYPEEAQKTTVFKKDLTTPDGENAIAWTKGSFIFHKERLGSVMRQLARWYNIKVLYKNDDVENILIGASISRSKNLKEVLGSLELTQDVHFTVSGNQVVVSH